MKVEDDIGGCLFFYIVIYFMLLNNRRVGQNRFANFFVFTKLFDYKVRNLRVRVKFSDYADTHLALANSHFKLLKM